MNLPDTINRLRRFKNNSFGIGPDIHDEVKLETLLDILEDAIETIEKLKKMDADQVYDMAMAFEMRWGIE